MCISSRTVSFILSKPYAKQVLGQDFSPLQLIWQKAQKVVGTNHHHIQNLVEKIKNHYMEK